MRHLLLLTWTLAACTAAPGSPDEPAAPQPSGHTPPAGQCSLPVANLVEAWAIPHGKTGRIELVLSNHPASCAYWADDSFRDSCDVWRARVDLPPELQAPGTYPVDQSFAYLDHRVTGTRGAWADEAACRNAGHNLTGSLTIDRITDNRIVGSVCGTPDGVIDGRFEAIRCPTCAATSETCSTDADCCSNHCGSGRTCAP